MKTFPESLISDRTKNGKQSTIVHETRDNYQLILSLNNGVLTLNLDGTWEWSERK